MSNKFKYELKPKDEVPEHGMCGGPLVCASVRYEDGTEVFLSEKHIKWLRNFHLGTNQQEVTSRE